MSMKNKQCEECGKYATKICPHLECLASETYTGESNKPYFIHKKDFMKWLMDEHIRLQEEVDDIHYWYQDLGQKMNDGFNEYEEEIKKLSKRLDELEDKEEAEPLAKLNKDKDAGICCICGIRNEKYVSNNCISHYCFNCGKKIYWSEEDDN